MIVMKSDDKDIPISNDFKKSQENPGIQVPDFLASKFGAVVGLGAAVIIVGIIYAIGHIDFSHPTPNPLEARPGYAALHQHVESLAEVDQLCLGGTERLPCLCELAERIREDRRAIDSLVASDPTLKGFAIEIRKPASVTYDFAKLPKAPEESECLNAVSSPTIIDEENPAQ
jgi:hypothetical protein